MGERGQLKISFGMIFSIILIITFFAFAFYIIPKLLDMGDDIRVNQFYEGIQKDVDQVWKSTRAKKLIEYSLPDDLLKVCFKYSEDSEKQEIYLKDDKRIVKIKEINHLRTNEECINVEESKISFYLEKDYGDNFVGVTKNDE